VVPDPQADDADWSDVRGIKAPVKGPQEICKLSTLHSSRFNYNHLTLQEFVLTIVLRTTRSDYKDGDRKC
jgi:hypothetical protein